MKKEFDTDLFANFEQHRKRSKHGFAILLVLAGLVLLGFNMGWIAPQWKAIIISWQMLIIVLGVFAIFKRRFVMGIIIVCAGIFFMLPIIARFFPSFWGGAISDFSAYWPVLLIVAGVLFIIGGSCRKSCGSHRGRHSKKYKADFNLRNESDYIEKNLMFNSSEQIVFSSNFKGGDLNLAFGEVTVDLRKIIRVDPDNMLEINTMFGSTVIYVPADWNINMKTNTLFAQVQDLRRMQANTPSTDVENSRITLNLRCSCMFGSIEIKN